MADDKLRAVCCLASVCASQLTLCINFVFMNLCNLVKSVFL